MKPTLRIAVASSGLGHVNRGIESWAEDLGRALHERGCQLTLYKGAGEAVKPYEKVLSCWQRESPKALRFLRSFPKSIAWRLGVASGYGIEQATFALKLIRELRRNRFDIVHVQDPQVALMTQRALRLGLISTKTILAHGTEEIPEFLRKFDYIQHLAPWHLERTRSAGAWKPHWTAIPNFIDTQSFHPGRSHGLRAELGIPETATVLLTAAAIKRGHKRIDHLLTEFAQLRELLPDSPVWLIVAGGWETETDELVQEGQRLLGNRVRFLVRFPRQRMAELYRSADLFVLCSLFEMMPIAIIEALASGLPCVVHRHPVLEWMTGPGGIPVDIAERGGLARALATSIEDSQSMIDLANNARGHCMANFSQDAVIDSILDYYRQIASWK